MTVKLLDLNVELLPQLKKRRCQHSREMLTTPILLTHVKRLMVRCFWALLIAMAVHGYGFELASGATLHFL
ncbi:hypothetical protein C6Y09_14260 [Lactiplantibacillus pentosus]|jgi:hypothetical protein|nr:hypothetical protein C6Y09_14260 [Lactiplantibacillus pentosus]